MSKKEKTNLSKSSSSLQSIKANPVQAMVVLAVLVALDVVIARFLAFRQWNIAFSFGFITLVIAARLYGWIGGAAVGALGDFIGAIAFPTGAYFPGFTLTAAIRGGIYGLCYKKSTHPITVVIATIITQILCSVLLNTTWVSVVYGANFTAALLTRLWQAGIMTVIEIVISYPILKATDKISVMQLRRA